MQALTVAGRALRSLLRHFVLPCLAVGLFYAAIIATLVVSELYVFVSGWFFGLLGLWLGFWAVFLVLCRARAQARAAGSGAGTEPTPDGMPGTSR